MVDAAEARAGERVSPSVPRHVLRLLRRHALALGLLVPLALAEVALDGGLTLSYRYLIDNAIVPENGHVLVTIVVALALGALVSSVLSLFRDYAYARLVTKILNDVRQATFDCCQRLSIDFYSSRQSGDILARFSTDLAGVEAALAGAVNGLLLPIFGVLVGVALLFVVLDWHVAFLGTLVWPLVLVGPRIVAPRAAEAAYVKKESEARLLVGVGETIQAHRTVKAFGLQAFTRGRFLLDLADLAKKSTRAGFLSALVERSTVVTIYVVQIAAVGVGAYMAYRKQVSVGSLVSFLTIFWNLGWSLVVIGRSAPNLVGAASSMRRIDELLNEAPDPSESGRDVDIPKLQTSIRFDDVTFRYNPRAIAMLAVSLEIKKGEYVAFVGPSGSGKSTALNLLCRFYDPQHGRISVDGKDVREASARALRAQMGLVMQESFLFDSTVRENIRLGRLDATDVEIEAAAKAAEIHEAILAMPNGYETAVGERGSRLSGGQRQRVAIARALLRDPAILLLDEASSALDPATEASLNETLLAAGRGRTTVSVTHRLATAVNADRIFVVQDARVVEQGSHAELLAKDRTYAELWRKQNGFVVSDDGGSAAVTAERLRAISLLNPLSDEQLASLATLFVSERAIAGQSIIRQGEPGSLFYLIARGIVRVSIKGSTRDVARLSDGDQFGEMALLHDVPRSATVTASTDCLFLTLTRKQFLDLIGTTPGVRAAIERIAAQRSAALKGSKMASTLH